MYVKLPTSFVLLLFAFLPSHGQSARTPEMLYILLIPYPPSLFKAFRSELWKEGGHSGSVRVIAYFRNGQPSW